MSETLLHRPPNLKANRFRGAFIGLLLALLSLYGWSHLALEAAQRSLLGSYAKAEIMATLPHSKRTPNPWPARDAALQSVFEGRSMQDLLLTPLTASLTLFALSFLIGIVLDKRTRDRYRQGKKLRGPDLLTPQQFNQKVKGDGYVFPVAKKR